jgi:hypothetical protein
MIRIGIRSAQAPGKSVGTCKPSKSLPCSETMRLHLLYHFVGVACFVLYVLFRLSSVLKTLIEDTTPYALSRDELSSSGGTQLTPKILHQVYLGWDHKPMPEHWREPQRSCIDLHTDWEYKVS